MPSHTGKHTDPLPPRPASIGKSKLVRAPQVSSASTGTKDRTASLSLEQAACTGSCTGSSPPLFILAEKWVVKGRQEQLDLEDTYLLDLLNLLDWCLYHLRVHQVNLMRHVVAGGPEASPLPDSTRRHTRSYSRWKEGIFVVWPCKNPFFFTFSLITWSLKKEIHPFLLVIFVV